MNLYAVLGRKYARGAAIAKQPAPQMRAPLHLRERSEPNYRIADCLPHCRIEVCIRIVAAYFLRVIINSPYGGRIILDNRPPTGARRNFFPFPTRDISVFWTVSVFAGASGFLWWGLEVNSTGPDYEVWIAAAYPSPTLPPFPDFYLAAWQPPVGFSQTWGEYWNLVLRPTVWDKFNQTTDSAWYAAH